MFDRTQKNTIHETITSKYKLSNAQWQNIADAMNHYGPVVLTDPTNMIHINFDRSVEVDLLDVCAFIKNAKVCNHKIECDVVIPASQKNELNDAGIEPSEITIINRNANILYDLKENMSDKYALKIAMVGNISNQVKNGRLFTYAHNIHFIKAYYKCMAN